MGGLWRKKRKKTKLVIIMIGPGGLLLVISYLFAVPILVLWVGFREKERKKKLNLDVRNIFVGHILSNPAKGTS
jgi:hypothetical protein